MEFKVGDKVILEKSKTVGTVTRVTPKRGDIVVDFGNYQATFDKSGWDKNSDAWYSSRIVLLTPEIEKEINDERIIDKCKRVFEKKSKQLTAEQAVKILEIMEEENEI